MPSNVGSVSVKVRLDDKDALKELESLRAKLAALQSKLETKRNQRDSIAKEMDKAAIEADVARHRVEQLQQALANAAPSERTGLRAELSQANSELRSIIRTNDSLNNKWQKLNTDIADGEAQVAKMQEGVANLERQIAASNSAFAKFGKAASTVSDYVQKKLHRLAMTIRRAMILWSIRTLLQALTKLKDYLGNVLMSIPEYSAAVASLKGALLTMVQPILDKVVPALITLLNWITKIAVAIGTLIAQLFGTTFDAAKQSAEALYEQADAYKATGSAAKQAKNQVAAFDQLNILTASDASGGGGGAAAAKPTFDFEEADLSKFKELLDIVAAIGSALLGWKIGRALGLDLLGIIGIAMILFGTFKLIQGYLDAWQNGVDLSNLLDMLGGLTIAAIGAYLAFGSMGAGIALVIGGLALLGLGFKDAMENGLNLANTLLIIAGLLALGIGIGLLTGTWIPLLIAGIAGALLALVYFTGHGDELMQGLRDTFEGFAKFVSGVFSGDMETALDGINQMGLGMEETFLSVIESMEDGFTNMFDTLNRLTNGVFAPILDYWKSEFESTITFWKDSLNGFNVFLEGVFTGDWEKAWYGLKMVVSSIINRVLEMIENAANGVVDTLNLLPFFDIQRVKLPRVDLTGGTQSGGQRGSGGRANTGAFRGKADRAIEENTKETTENTGSILEGVNDILKEMHTQTGLGSLQRNAANAYWERVPGVASGAVLPRSQAFINSGIDPAMNSVYDMGQLSDTIVQMTNQILSAIQNQEFATYLDGKKVSQQLYSPMQAVARTRGSALVKG